MKRTLAVTSTLLTTMVVLLATGLARPTLNWESVVLFGLVALSVRALLPSVEKA